VAFSERLQFFLSLNADGAIRGFQEVGRTAERELGKTDDKLNRVGGQMQRFGAGSMAAAGIVGVALYQMGNDASNLEQAIGGAEAVFGEASGTILDFADTTADSLGISNRATLEMTNQLGALLKGMGLTRTEAADFGIQVTQLGADAAAAFGGAPQEAVEALGATFRGEFNAAERFGVSLTAASVAAKAVEMGLADSTAEVDTAAKAQATLTMITEQLADVQGQSAREADTAAGQQARMTAKMEEARAEIGAAVLPAMSALFGAVADVAEVFGDLNEATDGAVGKFAVFGTAALGTVGAVSSVAGTILKASDRFKRLSGSADGAASSMRGLKAGAAVAGVGLAAVVAHQVISQRGFDDLTASVEDFNAAITSLETAVGDSVPVWAELTRENEELASAMAGAGVSAYDLAAAAQANDGSFEVLRDRILEASDEAGQGAITLNMLNEILNDTRDNAVRAAEGVGRVEEATGDAEVVSRDWSASLDEVKAALSAQEAASEDVAAATDAVAEAVKRAKDAEEERTEAIEASIDATLRSFDQTLAYEAQVVDTAEAIAGITEALEDEEATQADVDAARREALGSVLRQAELYAELNAETDSAVEKAQLQREELYRLRDTVKPGSPEYQAISDWILQLEEIPGVIDTSITATADTSEAIRRLEELERQLSRVTGQPVNVTSEGVINFGNGAQARAAGGFLDQGAVTLVGEQGPELVRQRGNQLEVLSAGRTRSVVDDQQPAQSGGPQRVINIGEIRTGADPAELTEHLRLLEMLG
jgi:hypothetical protein